MPQEIIITIDENGDATVEGQGFVGDECVKLTAALEDALGEVEERTFKPEYRRTRTTARKETA